ncbi:hypothetical protein KBD59_00100 [Candidatus Gracilibacteria bacterium]|nr:hypothetical protein [Candidatus Gracilibacteria bacterium]
MNKISKGIAIGLAVIALSACGKIAVDTAPVTPETPTVTTPPTSATTTAQVTVAEQKTLDFSAYKQWMIPRTLFSSGMVPSVYISNTATKPDCAGMQNGDTAGGDLLSSLIADEELRKALNLNVYTPTYVRNLENKIVRQIQMTEKNDFYAFSVCHLGPNVDVASGYLVPQGTPTLYSDGKFAGEVSFDFTKRDTLAVVYNDTVTLYEDIQLLNNTATGAEVDPCSGSLSGETVTWSCFRGLHLNEQEYVDGSKMAKWEISVKGGILKKTEYVEKTE